MKSLDIVERSRTHVTNTCVALNGERSTAIKKLSNIGFRVNKANLKSAILAIYCKHKTREVVSPREWR